MERAAALQTLAAIASSPDAVAESPAHLFATLDALVVVYATGAPDGLTARQAAARSPGATWANVQAHAENRLAALRRAKAGA